MPTVNFISRGNPANDWPSLSGNKFIVVKHKVRGVETPALYTPQGVALFYTDGSVALTSLAGVKAHYDFVRFFDMGDRLVIEG